MSDKDLIASYLKDNKVTKCKTVYNACDRDGLIRSRTKTRLSSSRNYCAKNRTFKAKTVDGKQRLVVLLKSLNNDN